MGLDTNDNTKVDMKIVEKFTNFSKDSDREYYIAIEADANKETLQYLLNDEPNYSIASTLSFLLQEEDENV